MRPDKKYSSDLDYLAELGFEKFVVEDAELDALKELVKKHVSGHNSAGYNTFIGLVMAVFLAFTAFFTVYNAEVIYPTVADKINESMPATETSIAPEQIELDTVTIVKENFTRPALASKAQSNSSLPLSAAELSDTLQVVELQAKHINKLSGAQQTANKLKFLLNSPVQYIHNLKVSDYTRLYFKRRVNSDLTGIPAAYASAHETGISNLHLKTSADTYLHEEISRALLLFKKEKYSECLVVLNEIASFNENDVNCSFYKGMCLYYTKNYSAATGQFEQSLANSNNAFAQEAKYYLALSMAAAGNKEAALNVFREIAEEDSFYSEKAVGFIKSGLEVD